MNARGNGQVSQVPIQQVEEENNNINEDEVVEEIENVDVLPGVSEDDFESAEEEPTPMKRGPVCKIYSLRRRVEM
ncbi:unnamed protein product [Ceratitis capitata]|uniref:(Mediterranean fruit fly) hypothetical protein n=1 Tax=Ceratitis capitata TaxID=7213 RepID=A0A811UPR7_CERCA|nr:unnamed protein product [Ceratitis capitata]